MADDTQQLRGINWREAFPFTHLFRTFRVAIHPSKILLGLILILMLYTAGRVLDAVWVDKYLVTPTEKADYGLYGGSTGAGMRGGGFSGVDPAMANVAAELEKNLDAMQQQWTGQMGQRGAEMTLPADADRRGIFITLFEYEIAQINNAANAVLRWDWLPGSPTSVVSSLANFVFRGPAWFFGAHPLYALLFTLLALVLWSVFGGAIARIAAIHVARDEKISIRQALRFSTSKVLSFAFAPLIPLIILLGLAALLGLGGLLLYVPYAGPIVVGAGLVFALLVSFVMTLVLFGTVGGFNLMYPTVAVEGSDSFDAISRSFSYVFARPWRTLFYSAVALAYGALTYLFVRLFIAVMLMLAHGSLGWFLGQNHKANQQWDGTAVTGAPGVVDTSTSIWPAPQYQSLTYDVPFANLNWSQDIGAGLIAFWVYLTISLLGAYLISFYVSSNTIIYYLLRREVDATDLDDVYVEQADEDFNDAATETTPTPAASTAAPAVADSGMSTGAARIYPAPETQVTPTEPQPPQTPPGGTESR